MEQQVHKVTPPFSINKLAGVVNRIRIPFEALQVSSQILSSMNKATHTAQ